MYYRIRTGFVSSFIYSGLIVSAFYSSPPLNSSRGSPVVFFVDTKLSQYFSQLLKLVLGNRFARVHFTHAGQASHSGEIAIHLVASCSGKWISFGWVCHFWVSKAVTCVKQGCLFFFVADSQNLGYLPFDLRLNSDILSHLKQFAINVSSLARMSSLANR